MVLGQGVRPGLASPWNPVASPLLPLGRPDVLPYSDKVPRPLNILSKGGNFSTVIEV